MVGVAIVAASVLLGSRLLATADDTVTVWAAADDLHTGAVVSADDVEPVEVRFLSAEVAGRYLPASRPLPSGLELVDDVTEGELLPRAAVGPVSRSDLAELPVTLPAASVPAGLEPGEVVDVWVTPEQSGEVPEARRVLDGARVVAVPSSGGGLGPAMTRQVVVGVPDREDLLARAIGSLATGTPVLVRQGRG